MQYSIYRRWHTFPTVQWIVSTCVVRQWQCAEYLQLIVFWHQEHLSKIYVTILLSIQTVCDQILSNMYRSHCNVSPANVFPTVCFHVLYIVQQCVSRYYTSGQPHHMPLPAVAAFPGILNIFPATNICKIFATNICQKSGFTPKLRKKRLKKLKVSRGTFSFFKAF